MVGAAIVAGMFVGTGVAVAGLVGEGAILVGAGLAVVVGQGVLVGITITRTMAVEGTVAVFEAEAR
jgi:hypothetical protein